MLTFVPLLLLLLLGLVVSSSPTQANSSVIHEARSAVPLGWHQIGRHNTSTPFHLRFALVQSNMEHLEAFLDDVSHPNSPNYGMHWTASRVAEAFAPTNETVDLVRTWLSGHGISADQFRTPRSRAWIEVNVTVALAEKLLETEYFVYAHQSGVRHIACGHYHLPQVISSLVDLVTPTIHFDKVVHSRPHLRPLDDSPPSPGKVSGLVPVVTTGLQNCHRQVTPDCLRALYNISYEIKNGKKDALGIVEYTPQAFVQSDLALFFKNVTHQSRKDIPQLNSIDGGVIQDEAFGPEYNAESNLDLQYAMALAGPRQDVMLYQVGDMINGASFNTFLDALDGSYCDFEGGDSSDDPEYPSIYPSGYQGPEDCGFTPSANVISTSYSYNEADLSPAYISRQCNEYGKLGLMGITILFASGDDGVAGNGGICLDATGAQTYEGFIYNPGFPASCPYVTAVGATQINPGAKITDPESACSQVIFSGGGFSNHFALPRYQNKAVAEYIAQLSPSHNRQLWNSTGNSRAFPDLSANGANFVVAIDGEFSLLFGTSASAPVVGAMVAMINDARVRKGKKPVGFINPAIYSPAFQDAFNDIESGSNPGCNSDGFDARAGWDPVTGLGTPNLQRLMTQWMALP